MNLAEHINPHENSQKGHWPQTAPKASIWKEMWIAITAWLLLSALIFAFLPTKMIIKSFNSNNVFHYVLGTKYFDELGYFDFYNGVILADAEIDGLFLGLHRTRDLETYKKIPVTNALSKAKIRNIRSRFTDHRWQEFKNDLRLFQRFRTRSEWKSAIADRGFNPSPSWLILHRPFLNWINIQNLRLLAYICYSQMVFYIIAFAFLWWAFGIRTSLVSIVWFLVFFGNWGRHLGGYFSYDWLCLSICAVSLLKKGFPAFAATIQLCASSSANWSSDLSQSIFRPFPFTCELGKS